MHQVREFGLGDEAVAAATQGDMVRFPSFLNLRRQNLRQQVCPVKQLLPVQRPTKLSFCQGAFVKALQKEKAGDGKDAPEDMALD